MQTITMRESREASEPQLVPLDHMGIIDMLEAVPVRNLLVDKAYGALVYADRPLAESLLMQVYDLPLYQAIKDDLVTEPNTVKLALSRIGCDIHVLGIGFLEGVGLVPMMYQSRVLSGNMLGQKTTLYAISPVLHGRPEPSIGIRVATVQQGVDIQHVSTIVPKEYPEGTFDIGSNVLLLDKDNQALL